MTFKKDEKVIFMKEEKFRNPTGKFSRIYEAPAIVDRLNDTGKLVHIRIVNASGKIFLRSVKPTQLRRAE